MGRVLSTLLLTLAFGESLLPTSAIAVPVATAQVGHVCRALGASEVYYFGVPSPTVQSTACSLDSSGTRLSGPYVAHSEGSAVAEFGTTAGRIGVTSADTVAGSDNGTASSNAYSQVAFYFAIELISGQPNPGLTSVPILLSATGVGHVARAGFGFAEASGIVQASGGNLNYADGRFEFLARVEDETAFDPVDYENLTRDFDESRSLNLWLTGLYTVITSSSCESWVAPIDGQSAGASATCTSWVDPVFAFDQAAFDAQMGGNTFALGNYYRLVFSENVPTSPPTPMPLPSSIALSAAGLLGLMLSRQRRQRPTAHR